MTKDNLRRVPIVDKNGKRTTVLKKDVVDAFNAGETDFQKKRRLNLQDTPFPNQLGAKEAVKEAGMRLFKGLAHGEPTDIIAGAIALSAASVYGMRELRSIGWEGNKDLSRTFLGRLADLDVNAPLGQELKKVAEPAATTRGNLGVRELAVLSHQHDQIEADARGATSRGEHEAAAFYEKTNNRLVKLVFEDDPAAKAEAIAEELRNQKFSDRKGLEIYHTGHWFRFIPIPYGFKFHTPDSQEFRDAHQKAALRMEQAAVSLRSNNWP